MNGLKEDIFILKTACLFHDPPNKAWVLKFHKKEAKKLATDVLSNTCLAEAIEQMEMRTKLADMLASSVDRWLVSKLVGDDYSLFPTTDIKLKNIFNPEFSQKIEQEPQATDNFAKNLRKLVEPIGYVRLAYHILYASYEPTWIELGQPASPADTRAPTHSIFDHSYATASLMNWCLEKDVQGILLFIDLGGVQRFISSSRKLSDLWLSSYLASALAWRMFWIFIKALGPDVMILPTCRGNPFYYHSLISELIKHNVKDSVIEKIKDISRKFAGYDPDKESLPSYAVVPVTATFLLPQVEVLKEHDEFKRIRCQKDLEEFVEREYQDVWRTIYNTITDKTQQLQTELGALAREAGRLLNEVRNFGFDKTPPLPIRVIALQTDDLQELLGKEERYKLYHYMFKLLSFEQNKRKFYRFRPEEDLKLFDMTSQPIKTWPLNTTKGFEYCSVCGYLPAIFIFPSKEDEYKQYLDIKFEPIFSLGEHLCPYCLIKRLLTLSEILKPVMDVLLGSLSAEKPIRKFISVCDIASMPFKRSLIEKGAALSGNPNLRARFNKQIEKCLKDLLQRLKIQRSEELARVEKPLIVAERDLLNKIESIQSEDLKRYLKHLLFLNTEASMMRPFALRSVWARLIKEINKDEEMKKYGENIEELNTYYAIIRCDGDNLHNIIRGNVKEGFGLTVKDYLSKALEGPASEVIRDIIDGKLEEAKRKCEKSGMKDIEMRLNDVTKFIMDLQSMGEIMISPSYHSTLSRALFANALRDINIVGKYDGLVIYAGGDDLLAITPVKNSLTIVQELRENYSFPSKDTPGFDKIGKYLIPSLASASRSFSVYFTHYMFPMYVGLYRSGELLEEKAKGVSWEKKGVNGGVIKKNSCILSYSPRGGEMTSLLPFSNPTTPSTKTQNLKYVEGIVMEIEKKVFSTSLIYDLRDNLQIIKPLIESKNTLLLEKMLKRLFEKNCVIEEKTVEIGKWVSKFLEVSDIVGKVGRDHLSFFVQFLRALLIYRSALKGVE